MNIMLKNDFIIPDYNNPNIVDLMRAVYCKYNIKIEINKNVETFKKLINSFSTKSEVKDIKNSLKRIKK